MSNRPAFLSISDAHRLVQAALIAVGTSAENATATAEALVRAEAQDVRSHGLAKTRSYVDQVISGKIDGRAEPAVRKTSNNTVIVDANGGFAFPALNLAVDALIEMHKDGNGVACAGITRSHHAGVLGDACAKLASAGFVSLAFANSPAAIPPPGRLRPLLGTNPMALGCPNPRGPPIVVDVAMSSINRSRIQAALRRGEQIEPGLAVDAEGQPTTDPAAILNGGAILPIGGAKGFGLALAVEILAIIAGGALSVNASSFSDKIGDPPHTGQSIISLSPQSFAPEAFDYSIAALSALIEGQGGRIPGSRRFLEMSTAYDSGFLEIESSIHDELLALAEIREDVKCIA